MCKIRQLFLTALVLCALTVEAHAQWASSSTEHDWRIAVGGCSFGIVQQAVYTISLSFPSSRHTTIYFGPVGTITTRFEAPFVAVVLLLPVGATAAFLVTRLLSGNRRGS
jgi:hypothetical protein